MQQCQQALPGGTTRSSDNPVPKATAPDVLIVDATADERALPGAAIDLLRRLGAKDAGTLGAIKNTTFGRVALALTDDQEASN